LRGSLAAAVLRPPILAAAAALAAGGVAAGRLPLLDVPGWELGMAGCLVAVLLGAPVGVAAARRELAGGEPSPTAAFGAATATLVALVAVLFGAAVARAALASPCSALAGAAFYPLLAVPSAVLAAALGTAAGFATRGRRLAGGLLYALLALGSLAASLAAAWRGPGAYAIDPLWGYWPGPVYDEALRLDARLVLSAPRTLALAGAVVAATALGLAAARGRRVAAPFLALLVAAGIAWALGAARDQGTDREGIARALGGALAGPRCELHFPREKPAGEAERLLRDCELDASEVAAALGIEHPPRASVWLYRGEEEKRWLVGAGRTDYTKPWLAEVHLTDAPAPHPSLRHELVHALASSFATGPLRVPSRWGVLIRAGLVEGLAVAVDLPRGEWTAHEWSRAMRDLGLMPGAASLVDPAGFLASSQARAYTVAGSFLGFLLERYGAEPVRRVYGNAGFAAAFGKPLPELEAEWSAFLDGVAVLPELRVAAEARFRPEGILGRRCAREVAGVEARAALAGRLGRAAEAAALWRRAGELSGEPEDLRAAGDALQRAGDTPGAAAAWRAALDRAGAGRPALRAALLAGLGDLAWRSGDAAGAAASYRSALALDPERAEARLLAAKLAALADPALGEAAGPWLLSAGDPAVALARLARSDSPIASYLVGRAFLSRGAPRQSVPLLVRAAAGPLPGAAFALEARRLLAEARCASGEWDLGLAGFSALSREADREADRIRAAAAARRCETDRAAYGKPVPASSDWPEPR
jgi:tetratricopeptide (TPR) repeat protein